MSQLTTNTEVGMFDYYAIKVVLVMNKSHVALATITTCHVKSVVNKICVPIKERKVVDKKRVILIWLKLIVVSNEVTLIFFLRFTSLISHSCIVNGNDFLYLILTICGKIWGWTSSSLTLLDPFSNTISDHDHVFDWYNISLMNYNWIAP